MTYHAKTFRLLNAGPRIYVAGEALVEEAESRLGIKLPPSVREWYSCQDAIPILADHSNADPPIPLSSFEVLEWQSRHIMPIRHENQGVCTWGAVLDGSDDPPVYVDVDTGGKEWQPLASTFSGYVYSCVWDYQLIFGQPALVQAQNCILSNSAIDKLKESFNEVAETYGWPGSTQYRFSRERAAILIWSSKDQADWFIASSDAESLEKVLFEVWDLDQVGRSLYENTPDGDAVLEKLKASNPHIS